MAKITTKQRIRLGLLLMIVVAVPLIVIEINSYLSYRGKAGLETVNSFPVVSTRPSETALSGERYESQIKATDDDNDTLTYTFACPFKVTDAEDNSYFHEECADVSEVHPSGMTVDQTSGVIQWDVPSDAEEEYDVTLYVHDGVDYVPYKFKLSVEISDLVIRQFEVIPSSGKVNPGETLKFRAVLESRIGIVSVTAHIMKGTEEVSSIVWTYGTPQSSVMLDSNSTPPFTFTPSDTADFTIDLEVETADGERSLLEQILSLVSTKAYASNSIGASSSGNSQPTFSPLNADNVLNIGETYSFDMEIVDADGDNINAFFVTPEGDNSQTWKAWIQESIGTQTTRNGSTVRVVSGTGVPTTQGSYMIAVTANDGLENHYITYIWTVVVQDPSGNDIPAVTIELPTQVTRVYPNGATRVRWNVHDENQIMKYSLYYSSNPTNKTTWKKITDLDYNYVEYAWTSNLPAGTYYVIVEAYDSNSGVGYAVTNPIIVLPIPTDDGNGNGGNNGGNGVDNGDDDGAVFIPPQITNVRPLEGSEVTPPVTISADLNAGRENEIVSSSIKIQVDGIDVTSQSQINSPTTQRASISYIAKDLGVGNHSASITFTNNRGEIETKSWDFIVKSVSDIDGDDTNGDINNKETKGEFEQFIDKIKDTWNEMPEYIRILIAIGVVLIILGILLFLPLLGSRDDSSTTYVSTSTSYTPTPAPSSLQNNDPYSMYAPQTQPTEVSLSSVNNDKAVITNPETVPVLEPAPVSYTETLSTTSPVLPTETVQLSEPEPVLVPDQMSTTTTTTTTTSDTSTMREAVSPDISLSAPTVTIDQTEAPELQTSPQSTTSELSLNNEVPSGTEPDTALVFDDGKRKDVISESNTVHTAQTKNISYSSDGSYVQPPEVNGMSPAQVGTGLVVPPKLDDTQ